MESGNEVIANIDNNCIDSDDIPELLGINHINKLCKKTSQKLNALTRMSHYMTFDKRKIYLKTFIASPLREKCPNTELFLVRIKENTDQK